MGNKICDENCFECKYADCIMPTKLCHENTLDEVVLVDVENQKYVFRSKMAASKFLGRSNTYVSIRLHKGKGNKLKHKDGRIFRIKE